MTNRNTADPTPSNASHDRGARRAAGAAALAAALTLACAVSLTAAAHASRMAFDVCDTTGQHVDVRVGVRADAYGLWYPQWPDTLTMAHNGYAYPSAGDGLFAPYGSTTVSISHGPEWVPQTLSVLVSKDTTLTVQLHSFLDMRALGFYSGDVHVHSQHPPIVFEVSTANALRIARGEDLAILNLLDQDYRFTGDVDPLSDARTLLYYSYEYRNLTMGHVALPGLREKVDWGCCPAPFELWPMLGDIAAEVAGPNRALFVLAHPVTTDDFDGEYGWPGTGLGREYPLLAATGRLDGFEVVSYSNWPNERWTDWYDALSSGLALTPTAGTDAVLNWFSHGPAGGWRVYADLGPGAALDYGSWIEAVRAGRTFVTTMPLVPRFRIGDVGPGGALEAPLDTTTLEVSFDAACATGLSRILLVSDRGTLWSLDLTPRSPLATRLDTTFTLPTATPVWTALRVEGVSGDRALLGAPALAHTNAVRFTAAGLSRRDPAACGRMLDRMDALERLIARRGQWSAQWHADSVASVIRRARDVYSQAFRLPPAAFDVVLPPPDGTTQISWSRAIDPEPGDRVRYRITVSDDSTFGHPIVFLTDSARTDSVPVQPGVPMWWRVEAIDRGGNVTMGDPPKFLVIYFSQVLAASVVGAVPRPRLWPNPARGSVRGEGWGADVVIVDVMGRRVAAAGDGLRADGGSWVWERRADGRRVPPGLYFVRSRARGISMPLSVLE
jgi:hypothetical protein